RRNARLDVLADDAAAGAPRRRAGAPAVPIAYGPHLSQLREPQIQILHVVLGASVGGEGPRAGTVVLERSSEHLKNRPCRSARQLALTAHNHVAESRDSQSHRQTALAEADEL